MSRITEIHQTGKALAVRRESHCYENALHLQRGGLIGLDVTQLEGPHLLLTSDLLHHAIPNESYPGFGEGSLPEHLPCSQLVPPMYQIHPGAMLAQFQGVGYGGIATTYHRHLSIPE